MNKKLVGSFISILLAFAGLVVAQPAQALVLNANGVALNFNEANDERISGSASPNQGRAQGDIVAYRGVATISSTVLDAVVETLEVASGTTISSFDGGTAVSGAPDMLQSNINTSGAGHVVYRFTFYVGGTYTGPSTGTSVTLQNVFINSYDLDSSGGSNQYTDFSGIQSYTLSNNTTLGAATNGSLLQFKNTDPGASYNAGSGAYTKGRVQVKYDNLSTISIKVGADNAGSGGTALFALDFSVGLAWTEGSTTIQTTSTTNSFNAVPTGSNDSKTVTDSVAASLDANDFGTFTDTDLNPRVKVRVESLPAAGTLQFFNGSSWVAVSLQDEITEQDLTAGNLRYTSNAGTTTDSLTFKVSDGLAYSASAYTLTITVTGGSVQALTAQTITYAQPANQLLSAGSLTVAPSASSGLTVTLTSNSTSICTVSGFVISFVANGSCVTTASQAGDSTRAAAPDVSRTFTISTPAQNTPAPEPVILPSPLVFPSGGKTITTTPISLSPSIVWVSANPGSTCLDLPTTRACGYSYTVAGKGTFEVAPSGVLTFTAVTGFIGDVSIWYRVVDRNGESNQALVSIKVEPAPKPAAPVVQPASGTTEATSPITLTPPTSYPAELGKPSLCLVDPADNVCKQQVTLPGKGTFTLNSNGTVSFVAAPGFVGTATVQLRATDVLGQSSEAPITVTVTKPAAPVVESTGGTTLMNDPIKLNPTITWPKDFGAPNLCLVDPADSVCKSVVTLPGKGTFTLNPDGSVDFKPAKGFVGEATVPLRATDSYGQSSEAPITFIAKKRGPVTITISGFADGSPVLTAAIKAKINAFLKAYADYKNVTCIGYTEGPTVLKTDAALSKKRAVNACGFVKAGLGKKLVVKKISAGQDKIEADSYRRITITLND